MTDPKLSRRPLTSRDTKWAAATTRWLAKIGLRPNQISMLSVVFGAAAGGAFIGAGMVGNGWRAALFVAAAACIQLRLLCNLFDGMMAVEGGFKTKSGEIYNELPDRFADAVILVCAGYAVRGPEWLHASGWLAAVFALITAYVRALGVSAGAKQHFIGPMAKPHRMAVLTVTCIVMAILALVGNSFNVIHPVLFLISAGCLVTIARRLALIVKDLESK